MTNIKYQLTSAINKRFIIGKGYSKYKDNIEKTNESRNIIYSYSELRRLLKMCHMFSNFIELKHNDLYQRQLNDISTVMWVEFLQTKVNTCNQNSLKAYGHSIKKICRCVNSHYETVNVEWELLKVPRSSIGKDAIRIIRPSRRIFTEALELMQESASKNAIILGSMFALRVAETVKLKPIDINFETMELTIFESKGKKTRILPIQDKDVEFLKNVISGKALMERICYIEEDTVNRQLSKMWFKYDDNVSARFKKAKTGLHAIRKMKATEIYEELTNDYLRSIQEGNNE